MKKPARSLACGIATVSLLGIGLSVGIAAPAGATPAAAPSWADVQAAKADQAEKQQTVDELASRLSSLQDDADAAGIVVQQAGQTYALAASKQQEAQSTLDDLTAQAKRAKTAADESAGQVAALVVELSRTGGGDLSTSMLVDSADAKDLLYQVGTMSHLSERSATVLAQAKADQKTVDSLAAQKSQAAKALTKATDATKTALDSANDTAAAANGKLAAGQEQQDEVLEQLAYLKGTTVATESAYYTEQRAKQAEAELAAQATTDDGGASSGGATTGSTTTTTTKPSTSGGGTTTTTKPSTTTTKPSTTTTKPSTTSPTTSKPATTTPVAPAKPSTPVTTTPSKPVTTTPTAPSTPSKAAGAIAYARAQLGKAYVLGGAGPNTWDCSGLVMMAYNSQGIATGGHNVVWQYNYFKSIGRLVPLSQRQAGDILFYSSNGTASGGYHDSIYTGGGMMVEAARPGVGVVERAVWTPSQLLPYVARPSGSL
ncbi:cell wall-associated NlpC family hydrolase [Curtobacterium sp. PhB130]|uniref:C40 family peptidase n=1 Tax=Curtobacterium sp. PhB130 TaxID=2485178 RepID=UPI000F4B8544|nr:NlpC/P60 family protein [Curtobacterium sp. PhB130]ROS77906.1 cell wall-associated NlpC family hydrolase [Curtobacterium sp. PhB130]